MEQPDLIGSLEFSDTIQCDRDAFVLEIPSGISDPDVLLAEIALRGRFPDYFGSNWNALLDCLSDFVWLDEHEIVIVHHDVPLLGTS